MATQREDQRHAYDQVRRAVAGGDGLMRTVATEIERVIGTSSIGTMSSTDRPQITAVIDSVIGRVFGASREAATLSDLTRFVERQSVGTGTSWFQRAWSDLDTTMREHDPVLWQRVRNHIVTAPLDESDRLMRAYHMLYGPQVDRARLARSLFVDPERRWVDGSTYRLSDRIWSNGKRIRKRIDQTITEAIRNGTPRSELARQLREYLDPEFAPLRYQANGKIVRTAAGRGNPSAASAVRRLIRTEIAHTNSVAVNQSAADVPGILGVGWRLSGSHRDFDECDKNATQDLYGLGPGVYPVGKVPRHPNHAQDLCCLLHVHKSREQTRQEIVDTYRRLALGDLA